MLRAIGNMVELIWNHPANEGHRTRALVRAVGWQLYKRAIRRPLGVRACGFKVKCYPDSQDAGRLIYFSGRPDPSEMSFCERYLRSGDRVIDAGANIGIYTLLFASLVGSRGQVIAFEPDPGVCSRLRENVDLNGLGGTVVIRQAAVSNTAGQAEFSTGADTGNTLYSLKTYGRPAQLVSTVTLDDEIGDTEFHLCKMDIEGAELEALKGMVGNLSRSNPPVLILELSERILGRSGKSVADVEQWLDSKGYKLWRCDDGELVPFVSAPRRPGQIGDAIAIAAGALAEVKERLATQPQ